MCIRPIRSNLFRFFYCVSSRRNSYFLVVICLLYCPCFPIPLPFFFFVFDVRLWISYWIKHNSPFSYYSFQHFIHIHIKNEMYRKATESKLSQSKLSNWYIVLCIILSYILKLISFSLFLSIFHQALTHERYLKLWHIFIKFRTVYSSF